MGLERESLYTSSMLELIDNIVEVVVNSYFYWVEDYHFKEDLKQEGYYKAYELLKTGNYDPNQSLRNYLYTGVRNAMTNFNYHNNKEKHTSYDVFNDNIEDSFLDVIPSSQSVYTEYSIDMDIVTKSCEKFDITYMGNVLNYFRKIGLHVPEIKSMNHNPNQIKLTAIIVDILWNI